MTHPLHEKIRQIVKPMFQDIMQPTKGVVLEYSNEHNYARVEINNPYEPGKIILPQVPVAVVNGMHMAGPFVGDEVWVVFTGGKITSPMIVSIADRNYDENTRQVRLKHEQRGPWIPDSIAKKV